MDIPTPKERLDQVLEAKGLIKQFISEVDEAEFLNNILIQSAVQYQFFIIFPIQFKALRNECRL